MIFVYEITDYKMHKPTNASQCLQLFESRAKSLRKAKTTVEQLEEYFAQKGKIPILSYYTYLNEELDFLCCLYYIITGPDTYNWDTFAEMVRQKTYLHTINMDVYLYKCIELRNAMYVNYPIISDYWEHINRQQILKNLSLNPQKRFPPCNPWDNEPQNTTLHVAVALDATNILERLLQSVDVNTNGFFGDAAISWAAILLRVNCYKQLLDNGSRIDNLTTLNLNVFHWFAALWRFNNDKQTIKELLEYTKNKLTEEQYIEYINHRGKEVFSPIEIAPDLFK